MKKPEKALEEFIRDNRRELDRFDTPAGLWEKIADQLEADEDAGLESEAKVIPMKPRRAFTLRIAAAVLLLLGVYGVFQMKGSQTNEGGGLAAQENTVPLAEVNPELAEAESYYTLVIEQKRQEIAQFASQISDLPPDFQIGMDELDSMYTQLKAEFFEMPDEEVMGAMIQNLQMRIEILNRQLEILKQIQELKNTEENETLDTI